MSLLTEYSLIQEVKKYPCLYNNTVPDYFIQDVREKAWREVGRALNLSASECMENWNKSQISYELHVNSNLNTNYYLAKEMEFTLPFMNCAGRQTIPKSYSLEDVQRQLKLKQQDRNLKETFLMEEKLAPSAPKVDSVDGNVIEIKSESDSDDTVIAIALSQGPPATDTTEPSPQTISESGQSSSEDNEDDPEQVIETGKLQPENNKEFLLSLLPSLNEMTESQVRQFKMSSLQIVEDIFCKK